MTVETSGVAVKGRRLARPPCPALPGPCLPEPGSRLRVRIVIKLRPMPFVRPGMGERVRRGVATGLGRTARRWVTGGALAISLLSVAACASTSGDATAANAPAAGSSADQQAGSAPDASAPDDSAPAGSADADCTRATKVAIVEKTSPGNAPRYVFRPNRLTIQRGGFLAVTNKSDTVHTLLATPDAGIVTSVLDRAERQVIQFPD